MAELKTLDRYTNSTRMPLDVDARMYKQYLGVLSLLGVVARVLPREHAERANIERAMVDANVVLRQKDSGLYFEHASDGGYAAFERPGPTDYAQHDQHVLRFRQYQRSYMEREYRHAGERF